MNKSNATIGNNTTPILIYNTQQQHIDKQTQHKNINPHHKHTQTTQSHIHKHNTPKHKTQHTSQQIQPIIKCVTKQTQTQRTKTHQKTTSTNT